MIPEPVPSWITKSYFVDKIVSAFVFQNKLFIATEHRVFSSVDGGETFKAVEFEIVPPKNGVK